MLYTVRYLSCFIISVIPIIIFAQIEFSGTPLLTDNDIEQLNSLTLEINEDIANPLDYSRKDINLKNDQFAHPVKVNISPDKHGKWFDHFDSKIVWAMKLDAKATSLNIIFSEFRLVKGVKLFVYDQSRSEILGAYTYRNNKKTKKLAVSPVHSSCIIIEMQIPRGIEYYGELSVGQVGVGFKTTGFRDTEDKYYGWSAGCHIDINCLDEENYQKQKYSVCRVIYSGTGRCSGVLLNNLRQDGEPYLLTARHCIRYASQAEEAIFSFNYESPECDGPDGQAFSISGSEIVATTSKLDFTLLKLSEKPPLEFLPLYAGWDATGNTPQSAYTIHHPEGDVKKISIEEDSLVTGNLGYGFDYNTHWVVEDYEYGSTESGSSGGPLFDQNNHVIGDLSGGDSVCLKPIIDFYQKFSHCWADYAEPDQQLKAWLDPDNTGILTIGSYDPARDYAESAEIITNIDSSERIIDGKSTSGWGYVSGHNDALTDIYAEHYYRSGSKYIYGVLINPSRVYYHSTDATMDLIIWDGGDIPGAEIFRQSIDIIELEENQEMFVRLDSVVLVDFNFFVGYQVSYSSPIDTMAIQIVQSSAERNNTAYRYTTNGWTQLADNNRKYFTSLAVSPLVYDFNPDFSKPDFVREIQDITVYPNPATDKVQIYIKDQNSKYISMSLFDLSGRMIMTRKVIDPEPNIPFYLHDFPDGIYILKIESETEQFSNKIIKINP